MNIPPVQPGWNCPNCGLRIEEKRVTCYGCGYLRQPAPSGRGNWAIIGIGLAIMMISALGFCGSCVVGFGQPGAMQGAQSPTLKATETGMIISAFCFVVGVVVTCIGMFLKKNP